MDDSLAATYWRLLIDGDLTLPDRVASIDDPRAGHVSGSQALRRFSGDTRGWLGERAAHFEPGAITRAEGRTVAEGLLHLREGDRQIALPVAVVEDETAVRVYHSLWPLAGRHTVRPPLLPSQPGLRLAAVMQHYQDALGAGDVEEVLAAFEPDGCAREPAGAGYVHCGTDELRAFYGALFASGGGIPLQHCTATDDGRRCALEYTVVRLGRAAVSPQAGIAVYERGPSGRLRAARIYDDVDVS